MSEEVTVWKEDAAAIAAFKEAGFDYKEAAERITRSRLPLIKIQSQTQTFEFADEEDAEKKFKRTFEGVIIDGFETRSYWKTPMGQGDGGSRPDCYSPDGVKPSSKLEAPQHPTCAGCPMDKYESGFNGRRKACQQKMNLILIDPAAPVPLPMNLRIPPTSRESFNKFLEACLKNATPWQAVVAKFSLTPAKNKDGIAYSILKIDPARIVNVKMLPTLKQLRDLVPQLKATVAGEVVEEKSDVPF